MRERLLQNKYIEKVDNKLQNTFFGKNVPVSLHLILSILVLKLQKDAIQMRAQAVAFNLTLASFPFLIFLITLIPYFPVDDLIQKGLLELQLLVEPNIYKNISSTVYDFMRKPNEGLLSLGFVTAMYLATNGMQAFITAFNRSLRISDKRNFLEQRLIAWTLTVVLSLLLIITIVLIVSGEVILAALLDFEILNYDFLYYSIDILRYLIASLMFFSAISLMYFMAPAVKIKWKTLFLGAMISTFLSVTVSVVFSYYITHFGNYDKLYGSIGAFIGFMVWLFAISFVILLGFELNVSIQKAKMITERKARLLAKAEENQKPTNEKD